MIPAWTIRDLERRGREQRDQERPQLRIEEHAPTGRDPAEPTPSREPIVIQIWS